LLNSGHRVAACVSSTLPSAINVNAKRLAHEGFHPSPNGFKSRHICQLRSCAWCAPALSMLAITGSTPVEIANFRYEAHTDERRPDKSEAVGANPTVTTKRVRSWDSGLRHRTPVRFDPGYTLQIRYDRERFHPVYRSSRPVRCGVISLRYCPPL
jgi:hypothetical protein